MGKKLKAGTNRKPPEPRESHAEIGEWIGQVMPRVHPIVKALDKLIRDTIPGLQYGVKWGKAYYGLPGKGWIIEVASYHVSVNVVFHAGAEFDPPPPLGEGSRYVKVRTLEEAKTPEMRDWIEQAATLPGWK